MAKPGRARNSNPTAFRIGQNTAGGVNRLGPRARQQSLGSQINQARRNNARAARRRAGAAARARG